MIIGILTVSDRASLGEYEDLSGPAIRAYLDAALSTPWSALARVVPDGTETVGNALIALCDAGAGLVLATGGTGPSPRDQTPEAMASVIDKELPGFGELMRRVSLRQVPTAILSRQSAGIRGRTLIVTLPGKPTAIKVCLDAVFPAIPYCLELIGAGLVKTHPNVVPAFRPAQTPPIVERGRLVERSYEDRQRIGSTRRVGPAPTSRRPLQVGSRPKSAGLSTRSANV